MKRFKLYGRGPYEQPDVWYVGAETELLNGEQIEVVEATAYDDLLLAVDAALKTTWIPDDPNATDTGWGDEDDTLYENHIAALAALQPHWLEWGNTAWGLAGAAQAEIARLRHALERCRDATLVTPDAGWVGESPHLIARAALEESA